VQNENEYVITTTLNGRGFSVWKDHAELPYYVTLVGMVHCTCPAFYRFGRCKHVDMCRISGPNDQMWR